MTDETILVVDDGKENIEFVVDYILRPSGFRTLIARDGREGYELALSAKPDLILLDYQMPRMDGIQVLEAMRERNINIPVILMTFHGSEDVAIHVFRLGVRDYVMKPFTVDEMLDAINHALTETRLRREKEALTDRLLKSNRELQRRIRELNVLYSIGKSVTGLLDIDQLFVRIVEAAAYVTGAEQCILFLLEDEQLLQRANKSPDGPPRAIYEPSTEHLPRRVMKTGMPVQLSGAELSGFRNKAGDALQAVLYVPLLLGEDVLGVLGVDNAREAYPFTEHHCALLSALADYAAIAIHNARLFAQAHGEDG